MNRCRIATGAATLCLPSRAVPCTVGGLLQRIDHCRLRVFSRHSRPPRDPHRPAAIVLSEESRHDSGRARRIARVQQRTGDAIRQVAARDRAAIGEDRNAEESRRQVAPVLLAVVFIGLLSWAILRRRAGIAFGLISYVLTALPVLLMPYTRQAYWMYAPQMFLILALCLLLEEGLRNIAKTQQLRWVGAVGVVAVCMGQRVAFRRSDYFRDRVHWMIDVRRISARTARDASALIPELGPGTHVYVNHAHDTQPWLFMPGPCSYLQVMNQQRSITCVLNQPMPKLREMYLNDQGPKYFVDYHEDGSIIVEPPGCEPERPLRR